MKHILALMITGSMMAAAQDTPAPPPEKLPGNRQLADPASWRSRYELGPGDTLNFSLYGRPELERVGFRIAPDGTASYLQAQNVVIAGLTLDEARLKIEDSLRGHYRNPRVIITPGEVGSKRYTILGKVIKRGAVTLDHPITLIEAVARAGGIETGLFERRTIELADLERSFISRNGKPLTVDFQELFQQGDLSQNVEIEPNDYIYIASSISNDYYVIGAVNNPGVQGYTPNASLVAAITRRGGFTDRAWTDRALVVRGSLTDPETFAISVKDILAAEAKDFKVQPKDIIYIAERPWIEVEDILKLALATFTTSAASTWTDLHVDPVIPSP